MTPVDVIVPAREKVSTLPRCLDAILANTACAIRLLVVDVHYPPPLRRELDKRAAQDEVSVVRADGAEPILANAAFNLAFQASTSDLVMVIENDVMAAAGCIDEMAASLRSGRWDLVSPVIRDGLAGEIHFDPPVSRITGDGDEHEMQLVRRPKPGFARIPGERRISHLEKHAFGGTKNALERLYPFDEKVTTRTDVDLSLSAYEAGLRIGMIPTAAVDFIPPPINKIDAAFFAYRWDIDRAREANNYIVEKWHLINSKNYLHFAEKMQQFLL